jgi:hypothetical protein
LIKKNEPQKQTSVVAQGRFNPVALFLVVASFYGLKKGAICFCNVFQNGIANVLWDGFISFTRVLRISQQFCVLRDFLIGCWTRRCGGSVIIGALLFPVGTLLLVGWWYCSFKRQFIDEGQIRRSLMKFFGVGFNELSFVRVFQNAM